MGQRSRPRRTFLPRRSTLPAMRRILLIGATAAVLCLPAAAAARGQSGAAQHPGFLVVSNAAADGGVTGKPVVTVVVAGFVLGRVSQEGQVEIYHLASSGTGRLAAQASGPTLSRSAVTWRGVPGTMYSGSGFRFRAVGGAWRVVIRGSGVSVFAGGHDLRATLLGSVAYPKQDGTYAFDGEPFRSLPSHALTRRIGAP